MRELLDRDVETPVQFAHPCQPDGADLAGAEVTMSEYHGGSDSVEVDVITRQ